MKKKQQKAKAKARRHHKPVEKEAPSIVDIYVPQRTVIPEWFKPKLEQMRWEVRRQRLATYKPIHQRMIMPARLGKKEARRIKRLRDGYEYPLNINRVDIGDMIVKTYQLP